MKILSTKTAAFVFALGFGLSAAEAGVNLSNVPLQTGNSVEPNVLFIIDDSGSMHFELMPEQLRTQSGNNSTNDARGPTYMFPRGASGLYGGGDNSTNNVPSFRFHSFEASDENERITAAYYRSSAHNTIYYNPAVTYRPWRNADNTGPYVSWGGATGNANPQAAFHHPIRTDKGSINLTVDNTRSASWVICTKPIPDADGCISQTVESRTFYPAVYYHFKGGNIWDVNSYEQVEIRSSKSSYSGHGREKRSDCSAGICSYEQEIQNFANWYTYYRSRLLASQAGVGLAFSQQGGAMRVGFGTLNAGSSDIDGVQSSRIVRGVRPFSGQARQDFFRELYTRTYPFSGTPLREALDAAGQYFSRNDNRGPWSATPGTVSNLADLTCRQSFTVLMTDGYWSDTNFDAVGNQDGSAGNLIKRPEGSKGENYTYEPKAPFSDSYSNTLADVAMKYWKNDLRPDLPNQVPTTTQNPAFWQHMVTFGVSLGLAGTIPPVKAFNAISSGENISWPQPLGFTSTKIDDLLHAAVNSRGGFFSADDPQTFAAELTKTLSQIVARVASASNLVGATTSLETDKQIFQGRFFSGDWSGDLWGYSIDNNVTPNWKASENLNNRDWETRQIFYSKQLGATPGAIFTGIISPLTQDQVNYIRGDRSKELNKAGGIFRVRNSVLGDIAHSSPFYVGAPENRFYERFGEWPKAELDGYQSFLDSNKNRTKAVYVGSNNGMLHAFDALNGQELFAFIPNEMLAKLPALTSKDYQHQFYVDGSVTVADAYVGTSWRSVLVGVNGRGGRNIFALDVTRPESFNASRVLWEKAIPELGYYTGQAIIAKVADSNNSARWYAILGNGVNSQNHTASLILVPLDGGTHRVITAATGSAAAPNGLFQPEGFDVDNSGVIDRVYAGDFQGNVWEFNLKDGKREVAYSGTPLFVAKDGQGNRQAITGGMTIAQDGLSGNTWMFFGTGKYLETTDQSSVSTQSWYGLILPNTNTGTPKQGNKKNPVIINTPITGRSELAERTITNVDKARVVSETTSLEGKRGWFMDLPDQGERITSTPQMIGSTLVMNTMVPKADQCSPEGFGYVMAVDPFEGTRLKRNFFDVDGSKVVDDQDRVSHNGQSVVASGIRFESAPGQPIFYQDIMKVSLENADVIDVVVDTESRLGRVSWREVVN